MQRGHERCYLPAAPCSAWPADPGNPRRGGCFWRPSAPQPGSSNALKAKPLGSAELGCCREAVWASGTAARPSPGPHLGRALATPNDSPSFLLALLVSPRDIDPVPAIRGGWQLLRDHKCGHNYSLFSLPAQLHKPLQKGEHLLRSCDNFVFFSQIYPNTSTRKNIGPRENFLGSPEMYCSFHPHQSSPISPQRRLRKGFSVATSPAQPQAFPCWSLSECLTEAYIRCCSSEVRPYTLKAALCFKSKGLCSGKELKQSLNLYFSAALHMTLSLLFIFLFLNSEGSAGKPLQGRGLCSGEICKHVSSFLSFIFLTVSEKVAIR